MNWNGVLCDRIPGAVRNKASVLAGRSPKGRDSECAANRNRFIIDHRLSRHNVKLFLREP